MDGSISALGNRLNFLDDQLFTVHSNVLEEDVTDQSVLALGLEVLDLGGLLKTFELGLACDIQLMEVFLERFEKEILSFIAHDLDLAGDPLVHFLLSFNGFLGIQFFGDLSNF